MARHTFVLGDTVQCGYHVGKLLGTTRAGLAIIHCDDDNIRTVEPKTLTPAAVNVRRIARGGELHVEEKP